MTKPKPRTNPKPTPFRVEYETYDRPRETSTAHHARAPSFFNGVIQLKRYRVVIEEIVEPLEVYQERLRELHRTNKQPHSAHHLHEKATELGIILDPKEAGQVAPRSACNGCEFLWHGERGRKGMPPPSNRRSGRNAKGGSAQAATGLVPTKDQGDQVSTKHTKKRIRTNARRRQVKQATTKVRRSLKALIATLGNVTMAFTKAADSMIIFGPKMQPLEVYQERLRELHRMHTPPTDHYTIALYDETGRCKVYTTEATTKKAAEAEALAYYEATYPGRVYTTTEPQGTK